MIQIGGAAGHCPPVQKVTDYSSTSIVCLGFLQLTKLKNKRKCSDRCAERFPLTTPLRVARVIDMYMTPRDRYVAYQACDDRAV
jgi:hypothetical protein